MEADRAELLESIRRLDGALKESETDRAARLAVIQELDTALKNRRLIGLRGWR